MKKQLLFLGAFLAVSSSLTAQNIASKDDINVWLKPNAEIYQMGLNGYSPINIDTNQWHDFTNEKANLYVVFRTQAKEKTDLIEYNFACFQESLHTAITDERIPTQEMMQKKLQTGAIFKHSLNIPSVYINNKNGNSYFLTKDNPNTEIYELLYFNKEFTPADHQRVQTYLSLKYGISLLEDNNYVNQKGENVWDIGLNRNYNEYIFGLARIDEFGLNQQQTINSLQPNLKISSYNNFSDEEYLLLGNNGGNLIFVDNQGEKILERQYLYQNNGSKKNFQLSFNHANMEGFELDEIYILQVNHGATQFDVKTADVYLGRMEGENLIFDNVEAFNHGLITLTSLNNTANIDGIEWANAQKMELYPNPVKVGEKFHIDLNFNQPTDVDVYIYQVNGKLVSHKRLNSVSQQTYEQSITTVGNYLVMVQAGGKLNTFKLLVK